MGLLFALFLQLDASGHSYSLLQPFLFLRGAFLIFFLLFGDEERRSGCILYCLFQSLLKNYQLFFLLYVFLFCIHSVLLNSLNPSCYLLKLFETLMVFLLFKACHAFLVLLQSL
jgi:hypothetical protein